MTGGGTPPGRPFRAGAGRVSEAPAGTSSSPTLGLLDSLALDELRAVLRTLLVRHPELAAEADALAAARAGALSVEAIADDVHAAVTSLGLAALQDRAGRHAAGYVTPQQASRDLLEEAVAGHLADMRRRAAAGLVEPALALCRGIVFGLSRAQGYNTDGPLGWSSSFPAAHACWTVAVLAEALPTGERDAACDQLLDAFRALGSDWQDMLTRAAERAFGRGQR